MLRLPLTLAALTLCIAASAQTIDTAALSTSSPSTIRAAYEICQYVSLTPDQQKALAAAIDEENALFLREVAGNDGFLHPKSEKKLQKMRERTLARILTDEQLHQYYRGAYNAEALAEGNGVANRLRSKYDLTDQNWKFIRNAFYRIGLESRVIKKVMAATPKEAEAAISRLRDEQLADIEARGGIRVNPAGTKVEFVRPFSPTELRKQ